MNVIGIDPGITGALAWFQSGQLREVADLPVMAKAIGKGQMVNPSALRQVLAEWRCSGVLADWDGNSAYPCRAFVEYVNAMPPAHGRKAGTQSSFNFGHTAGVIEGVLGALGLPYVMVMPASWKKRFRLLGKDKDAARTLCIQRYPTLAGSLSRKKDCGRADAILIGQYGLEEIFT